MTDEQLAYTVGALKEYGLLESGAAADKGIGCFNEADIKNFYDNMVKGGVLKTGLDISKLYTTEFVCQGLGMDLKK
jgi:NitT/TauT family transport system substrate-binding protein